MPSVEASASEESKEERIQRRARETSEVEVRVKSVLDSQELLKELESDQLVVLEVESDSVCELRDVESVSPAYFEQPEEVLMEPCGEFKHSFQRIARNCPDVKFLSFIGDESKETLSFVKDNLGVSTFPTLQFYKVRPRSSWVARRFCDAMSLSTSVAEQSRAPYAHTRARARVRACLQLTSSHMRLSANAGTVSREGTCSGSTKVWTMPFATSTRACSFIGTVTLNRITT